MELYPRFRMYFNGMVLSREQGLHLYEPSRGNWITAIVAIRLNWKYMSLLVLSAVHRN
jgi:hypothetical protein